MPLSNENWLVETLRQLVNQVQTLSMTPALANASSDGDNGQLIISANAVSGQPALQFHYTGGGGDLLGQIYQTTAGAIQITGGLQVSGTKNFVMNHPTRDGWLLRHASTESPVNGVEYWGEGTVGSDNTVVIQLPAYFEKLTKNKNRAVFLTAQGAPTSLAYDPIVDGAFTVRGVSGTVFSWLVKAERASLPGDWPIDFRAEEPGEIEGPPEEDGRHRLRKRASSSMTYDPTAETPPPPDPAPTDPAPADPSLSDPAPTDPAPVDPSLSEPASTPIYDSMTSA